MDTFDVTYRITLKDDESLDEKVDGICREQSVELPKGVVSDSIRKTIVGSMTDKEQLSEDQYRVVIRWPVDNTGGEISAFINLLYGNISLLPGIQITELEWPSLSESGLCGGPESGINELRETYDIHDRALISTALKPVGLSSEELGELCYEFAVGGMDIIKDDDGITNQDYAPFRQRVSSCVQAVERAAQETGRRSYYFPHVTSGAKSIFERYEQAAELGADGVLYCPHIGGLQTMHELARHEAPLPIMAHPTFSGQLVTHPGDGFSPDFLYGQLWRALGADFSIFANTGGRFPITRDECLDLCHAATSEQSPFSRTFPTPGGGMKLDTVPHWLDVYGKDTVFLIGGALYQHDAGVRKAAEKFRTLVEG